MDLRGAGFFSGVCGGFTGSSWVGAAVKKLRLSAGKARNTWCGRDWQDRGRSQGYGFELSRSWFRQNSSGVFGLTGSWRPGEFSGPGGFESPGCSGKSGFYLGGRSGFIGRSVLVLLLVIPLLGMQILVGNLAFSRVPVRSGHSTLSTAGAGTLTGATGDSGQNTDSETTVQTSDETTQQEAAALVVTITQITPDTLSVSETTSTEVKVFGQVTNQSQTDTLSEVTLRLRVTSRSSYSPSTLMQWVNGQTDSGMGWLRTVETQSLEGGLAAGETKDFTFTVASGSLPAIAASQWGGRGVEVSALSAQFDSAAGYSSRSLLITTPDQIVWEATPVNLAVIAPLSASDKDVSALLAGSQLAENITTGNFRSSTPQTNALGSVSTVKRALNASVPGLTWLLDPALLDSVSPLQTQLLLPVNESVPDLSLDADLVAALQSAISQGAEVSLDTWGAADSSLLTVEQLNQALSWTQQLAVLVQSAGVELQSSVLGVADSADLKRVATVVQQLGLDSGDILPVVAGDHLIQSNQVNYQPNQIVQLESEAYSGQLLADYRTLAMQLSDTNEATAFTSTQLARATLAGIARQRPNDPRLMVANLASNAATSSVVTQRLAKIFSDAWVDPIGISAVSDFQSTQATTSAVFDLNPDDPQASTAGDQDSSGQSPSLEQVIEQALAVDQVDESALLSPRLSTYQTAQTPAIQALNTLSNLRTYRKITAQATSLNNRFEAISTRAYQVTTPMQQQVLLSASRILSPANRQTALEQVETATQELTGTVRISASSSINLISLNADLPIQVVNDLPIPISITVDIATQDYRLEASAEEITVGASSGATARIPVRVVSNGNLKFKALLLVPPEQGLSGEESVIDRSGTILLRIRATWEDHLFTAVAILVALVFGYGIFKALRGRTRTQKAQAEHSGTTLATKDR